jgi:hypothetical protein
LAPRIRESANADPNPVAGFILDKTIATNSPKRIENAKILIANTCERIVSASPSSLC